MITHTHATLGVSPSTYNEIREKLLAAGYEHVVVKSPTMPGTERLDLTGISLEAETGPAPGWAYNLRRMIWLFRNGGKR